MEIVCILILPGATFLLIWVYRYQGDEKNTHSTASGMSGPCQGSARYFIAGFNSTVSP